MTERQHQGRSDEDRRVTANPQPPYWRVDMRDGTDRRGGVQEQARGVTPVLTLRWGLFCEHLSRPDMPLLIARDKEFLEHYAEKNLRFAYVSWVIRPVTAEQAREWFRPGRGSGDV